MKLEVLPGRKGDCMLLHLGDPGSEKLVLIDGGPSGVWGDHLEERLMGLQEERAANDKLRIDLVIVSHVDDDHINGILRLLSAIEEDDFPVEIGEIWHNSFDRILDNDQTLASRGGEVLASLAGAIGDEIDEDDHERRDAALVLASIAQGDRLLRQAKKMSIPVNVSFGDDLLIVEDNPHAFSFLGAKFKVLGPLRADVEELQVEFDKWLREQGDEVSTASLLAALTDTSAANLSSIVLEVECAGRRFLLTGDARSDRFMKVMDDGPHHYDLIKIPHHGSDRNVDGTFFREVIAETYVFSGDGKHGNPERATVEMLLDNRPAGSRPSLAFTYSLQKTDKTRKAEWDKKQERRERKGQSVSPWDHEKMSLTALCSVRSDEFDLIEPGADSVFLPQL